MKNKTVVALLISAFIILAGAPVSFARPQYYTVLNSMYQDVSCGSCHIRTSGGGPLNSYGTLFREQPNHATDPGAALAVIGQPPASSSPSPAASTPQPPPTATGTTPQTPAIPAVTDTAGSVPAAPGFGIAATLAGLFACVLIARRHNK